MNRTSQHETDLKFAVITILKLSGGGKHPISYSELAEGLGVSSRSLGKLLDAVQELCASAGYPCLSALVGYKDKNFMPGEGFFVSYAEHYPGHADICAADIEKIRRKIARSNWSSLVQGL